MQSKCRMEETNTVDALKLVAKYLGVASEISFGKCKNHQILLII